MKQREDAGGLEVRRVTKWVRGERLDTGCYRSAQVQRINPDGNRALFPFFVLTGHLS